MMIDHTFFDRIDKIIWEAFGLDPHVPTVVKEIYQQLVRLEIEGLFEQKLWPESEPERTCWEMVNKFNILMQSAGLWDTYVQMRKQYDQS